MKSVPTFITRRSHPCTYISRVHVVFAYIPPNAGPVSVCARAEPLAPSTTIPPTFYIAKNKVHGLSSGCRDHCRQRQTRPAFFSSFSRINNSPVYTSRVKLSVYYPFTVAAINSSKRQLALLQEDSCATLATNVYVYV